MVLGTINFSVFLVALAFVTHYLVFKTDSIDLVSHFLICCLFMVLCCWWSKQQDGEFLFLCYVLFGIYKLIVTNTQPRLILISNTCPQLSLKPENSISFNVLYSKTLELMGSVAKEIVCEKISHEPKTRAKIAELIEVSLENGLKHRKKVGTFTIGSATIVSYSIANQRYIYNQYAKVEKNYLDSIKTSEHYATYKETRNPILQEKYQLAFEKAEAAKSNFTPLNLHEAIVFEALDKVQNPTFLSFLECGETVFRSIG
jgi:hypothetical protein